MLIVSLFAEFGSVNSNRLYKLSLYLMDFDKPCVIQEEFLCLYLLNFTHLLGMCLFSERKISLHRVLYLELGSAGVFFH